MRVIVTGTDEHGRSYVKFRREHSGAMTDEAVHPIFEGPLELPRPARQTGRFLDIAPSPGAAMWRVFEFAPGQRYDDHRTASIDMDTVVAGSMVLGLDVEEVSLWPGDCVLLMGDSHSWTAGPDGCRMTFALLGTSTHSSDGPAG